MSMRDSSKSKSNHLAQAILESNLRLRADNLFLKQTYFWDIGIIDGGSEAANASYRSGFRG